MTGGRRPEHPLRHAVRLMDPAPGKVAKAVLLGGGALGSAIGLIAASAWLIARASQMPHVLDLTAATVGVRALGIGRALFRYLERLASHDVALRGMVRLREQVYGILAADRSGRVSTLRRGDLLARFGADIDTVGDVVVKGLLPFAVSVVVGLVTVLGISLVLPAAGLLLLVCLLLTGGLAPWIAARAASRAREAGVDRRAERAAQLLAELDGRAELEVAGAQDRRRAELARSQRALDDSLDLATAPVSVAAAGQVLGVGLAVVGAVLLGAPAVHGEQLAPVMLAVLALVPLAASELTVTLPTAAVEIVAGRRAAQRLLTLTGDQDRAGQPAPGPAGPQQTEPGDTGLVGSGLVGSGLVVGWDRPLAAPPAQVRLDPGELIAVVGPSGTGKTTLALTLAGLRAPLAGQVTVDGQPLSEVADLAHVVSFTAHDAHVFGTSVRQNLLVATRAPVPDDDLLAAAAVTGLRGWLDTLPDGLDTVLASGGTSISGGQRRRLLLTRALLTGARYLVLDEPTEHLDPAAADAVFSELAALVRQTGLGIAVLTHADPTDGPFTRVLHLKPTS